MTDFPPLAERPDNLESDGQDDQQEEDVLVSPVVLDVLSVASERGLSFAEMLELAHCCLLDVISSLSDAIELAELPEDEKIGIWLDIGRLEAASEIVYSVGVGEEE